MQSTQTTQSPARSLLPRFAMGRVTITSAALATLEEHQHLIMDMLNHHSHGDWGDVCEEDREENELSVQNGYRIMSFYTVLDTKFYVETTADRSSTCIMLPSDY